MTQTVEGGVCKKCGEPEITLQGNGPKALPPGTKLCGGRLTVGKKLGNGGFGITYIAYDEAMKKRVALKEFLPNYLVERKGLNIVPKSGGAEAYQKAMNSFRKEAGALYELRAYPNIVHIYHRFRENNTVYYTMELLEGESFLSFLQRRKKISGEEAYKILFPIMGAVLYTHRMKILHRDISPDNIMLCQDPDNPGRIIPKLIDFGAAHVAMEHYSQSYPGMKKKHFSPLEQNWDGKYQGPWTDVYSLCATFYGAVIGTTPPDATDRATAIQGSARGEDPLKPARSLGADIPEAMDNVLMKGLALQPRDRIRSMGELMSLMTEARNSETNNTIVDLPRMADAKVARPIGQRIAAWTLDTLIYAGAAFGGYFLNENLQSYPNAASAFPNHFLMLAIPAAVWLLTVILLGAGKGTIGQILFRLKLQRDDLSEAPIGFGYRLLYALFYPGIIGMFCGIIWMASGKNIGPLESMCQGVLMRRKEQQEHFGGVIISRSISKPVSVQQAPREPVHNSQEQHRNPPPPPKNVEAREHSGKVPPPSEKEKANEHVAYLLLRKAADSLTSLQGKMLTVHSGDTLGKNQSMAKIVIPDQTISKLHCRFYYSESRGWVIKDENSTNGTFLGNQRIPAGGMAPLKPGTMIRLGKEILEFKI